MAIQENTVGLVIGFRIFKRDGTRLDVGGATLMEVRIQPPDGTTKTKTAVAADAADDWDIQYTTIDGDIVPNGATWHTQGYVEVDGAKFPTRVHEFSVEANL